MAQCGTLDWPEYEVIEGWVQGWASSRRTSPPSRVDSGWLINTSSAQESRRFVLDCSDASGLDAILAGGQPVNTCIKFVGHSDWAERFPADWVMTDPAWIMVRHLEGRSRAIADSGLAVRTEWLTETLVTAEIRTEAGELAARAQMGVGSDFVVPDQVVTEPAYRRRGLGSVLMADLEHAAIEAGVTRAVLGATADGRKLYETLGWHSVAPLHGSYFRPA